MYMQSKWSGKVPIVCTYILGCNLSNLIFQKNQGTGQKVRFRKGIFQGGQISIIEQSNAYHALTWLKWHKYFIFTLWSTSCIISYRFRPKKVHIGGYIRPFGHQIWQIGVKSAKMTPQQGPPTLTNPPILVRGIKIFKFCKKGMKVHTINYQNQSKTNFRPRPPPLSP